MTKELTPDPVHPEYAIDGQGNLYRHTVVVHGDVDIDIGYSPVERD